MPDDAKEKDKLIRDVRRRRERHELHEREGDASFWRSVGMMGTVGWSVALPLTAGVLLGRWIDHRLDSGHVFMFFCMLVGLCVGAYVAWRQISEKR